MSLARAFLGRLEEAETAALESAKTAGPDDYASQSFWRSVQAKVLGRLGEPAEAIVLAEEAVRLIAATDDLDSLGNAEMDLAEVYEMAGRDEEAAASIQRALLAFEGKGNVVSAAGARRRAEGLFRPRSA